jgi:hypothetical protein
MKTPSLLLSLLITCFIFNNISAQNSEEIAYNEKYQNTHAMESAVHYSAEIIRSPLSESIYIKTNSVPRSMSILTNDGKLLYEVNDGNVINLDELPGGRYILKIRFKNGEITKDLIL